MSLRTGCGHLELLAQVLSKRQGITLRCPVYTPHTARAIQRIVTADFRSDLLTLFRREGIGSKIKPIRKLNGWDGCCLPLLPAQTVLVRWPFAQHDADRREIMATPSYRPFRGPAMVRFYSCVHPAV